MFYCEEVVTCLEKPNGEIYFKLTKRYPNTYFKCYRKNFLLNDNTKDRFYTTGYYNQYNHKVVSQFIQFKFDFEFYCGSFSKYNRLIDI